MILTAFSTSVSSDVKRMRMTHSQKIKFSLLYLLPFLLQRKEWKVISKLEVHHVHKEKFLCIRHIYIYIFIELPSLLSVVLRVIARLFQFFSILSVLKFLPMASSRSNGNKGLFIVVFILQCLLLLNFSQVHENSALIFYSSLYIWFGMRNLMLKAVLIYFDVFSRFLPHVNISNCFYDTIPLFV